MTSSARKWATGKERGSEYTHGEQETCPAQCTHQSYNLKHHQIKHFVFLSKEEVPEQTEPTTVKPPS